MLPFEWRNIRPAVWRDGADSDRIEPDSAPAAAVEGGNSGDATAASAAGWEDEATPEAGEEDGAFAFGGSGSGRGSG